MIEVRIRIQSESDSAHLCDWDATKLDEVVPTIERWGIETDGNNYGLTGSFVYQAGRAYFEVLVDDESGDGL